MQELRIIGKNARGQEVLNCALMRLPLDEKKVLERTKEVYGPNKCCLTRRMAVTQLLLEELRKTALELELDKEEQPVSVLPPALLAYIRDGQELVSLRLATL